MRKTQALIVLQAALVSAGCDQTLPAKPLVDGCYYAGAVPVMRIQGEKGTLLVPGDVRHVTVERFAAQGGTWAGQAWVEFTPAFHIQKNPLEVSLDSELPTIEIMMKPGADQPTMWLTALPNDDLELVLGSDC